MFNDALMEIVAKHRGRYELPLMDEDTIWILPMSGGADSSCLAILMKLLFPHVNFEFVFTDTGDEDEGALETLNAVEEFLQIKIDRVAGEKSLYELIDDYSGFLPSPIERWCTRQLKYLPFENWISKFEGKQKVMFTGIRADEPSRLAFTMKDVTTEMPFVDLGIRREDVFKILRESIGVPKYYSRRTRSGCHCCPYQQRSERVGLLQEKPIQFYKASTVEKIGDSDVIRHQLPPTLKEETGSYWLALPTPAAGEISGKKKRSRSEGLFETAGIFVGAEFFFDGMHFQEEFTFRQSIVTYSPSLSGLKKQLDGRFKHLLSTYEVFDFASADDLRRSLRFGIYYLEADSNLFDPKGPVDPATYTWHKGESYQQLSHVIAWASRILNAEGIRQLKVEYAKQSPASWAGEQHDLIEQATAMIKVDTGSVTASQWYVPKEPPAPEEDPDNFDVTKIACPMCSI